MFSEFSETLKSQGFTFKTGQVGGHLFAIAAKKSVDFGYDGYMYGFTSNEDLLKHYVEVFNGEVIAMLHPYQFAIDEDAAKTIMEVYDYEWTDEEI